MKIKILYSITTLLIFAFAFVIQASLNPTGATVFASDEKCSTMKDCCKDGQCSVSKDGKCACECCKDGKCEMHKKHGDHQSMKSGCCGNSCPMKKGENKDKPKDN